MKTIEKACDAAPSCTSYTCWQVGEKLEVQCRAYSDGILVVGADGRETKGQVVQTNQVSSCKNCPLETEAERLKRCETKSDGTCLSAAEFFQEKCAKLDLRMHMDIENVPEFAEENPGWQQNHVNKYYTADQLQCVGLQGWPDPFASGELTFPLKNVNVTIDCPPKAQFCTHGSTLSA